MARVWQWQEAKKRLGQIIDAALSDGPQVIARDGEEVAVLISAAEYRRLTGKQQTLVEFFRASPLVGAGLDFSRDKGSDSTSSSGGQNDTNSSGTANI